MTLSVGDAFPATKFTHVPYTPETAEVTGK